MRAKTSILAVACLLADAALLDPENEKVLEAGVADVREAISLREQVRAIESG